MSFPTDGSRGRILNMDDRCRSCGFSDREDCLTTDGLCFGCDMAEVGMTVISEENVREMLDRVDEVLRQGPSEPVVVWDSLDRLRH